jgi:probable DNA metabolism protein
MQSVVYDGSWDGFLSAVFDVYEYKFVNADICTEQQFRGNMFMPPHYVHTDTVKSKRVWKGLQNKLTKEAQDSIYRTFLSELTGSENHLLAYIQYAFASAVFMESDFSKDAVIYVTQTARKVWREKHRMEAFVRFQKTADDLFYAIVEPDYNVLPLIAKHFETRYADQHWMIYDGKRKYGLYYNGNEVSTVAISFNEVATQGKDISGVYEGEEQLYQQLWQQYFKSVNIAARKNTKLHIQHMPRRYWKYLTEKHF